MFSQFLTFQSITLTYKKNRDFSETRKDRIDLFSPETLTTCPYTGSSRNFWKCVILKGIEFDKFQILINYNLNLVINNEKFSFLCCSFSEVLQ